MRFATLLVLLLTLPTVAHAEGGVGGSADGVVGREEDGSLILENERLRLVFSRQSGQMISMISRGEGDELELGSGRETFYWDANLEPRVVPEGVTPYRKGYWRPGWESIEFTHTGPDHAELLLIAEPDEWSNFRSEVRYTLFEGDSGFYMTAKLIHPADQPAARLWQTRFVSKVATDDTYHTFIVDEDRKLPIPKAEVEETLMDVTYRLADGTIKTKYGQSVKWAEAPVYGIVGDEVAIWGIAPSFESQNGGPMKQGQTVHDNVLLRVMQSVHFGASPVDVEAGEHWEKVYGPFFTYVTRGGDLEEMWADARTRQREEMKKWPYDWAEVDGYAKERGQVTGRVTINGQPAREGTLVLLAEQEEPDWALQSRGYQFWTETDANGAFTIEKARPGEYTLFVSGADEPEDFTQNGVTVAAGETNDVGTLAWTPDRPGKTLWQIGVFDRSAGEFADGDDARRYEMFRRYPQLFPEDVTFTIGESDPKTDWNYAHWTWYSQHPEWAIKFDLPHSPDAEAEASGSGLSEKDPKLPLRRREGETVEAGGVLTLGIASAQPLEGNRTDLRVAVNGHEVGSIELPKTGTSGYRGGAQDSPYNVVRLEVPVNLLKKRENVVTLRHADARVFPEEGKGVAFNVGQVMYDAIRFDLKQVGH